MSYQIIDDILDFTASENQLGKPAGNDLLQGNVTLPVLIAMKDPSFDRKLRDTFANPELVTPASMVPLIESLKQTGAIASSYRISDLYLQKH